VPRLALLCDGAGGVSVKKNKRSNMETLHEQTETRFDVWKQHRGMIKWSLYKSYEKRQDAVFMAKHIRAVKSVGAIISKVVTTSTRVSFMDEDAS
jgi:hypothetical protein